MQEAQQLQGHIDISIHVLLRKDACFFCSGMRGSEYARGVMSCD